MAIERTAENISVVKTDGSYEDYLEAAISRGEVNPLFLRTTESNVIVLAEPVSKESPHETAEVAEAARGMIRPDPWRR